MQVLLVCLVLFFVASELYQWIQGMTLPLPMLIVAGVALAIASNLRSLSVPSWSVQLFQVSATLPSPVLPNVSEPVTLKLGMTEFSVQLPNFIY
ncbi:MAG: hypothetical protein KME15_03475 [Drouetiella hepatica Uher 2000/2452]|jgi:hypothetical protein|uniref:Uncharacterized protein n=1 Tax=Drouetiella hepatica Uher 2000/2452 TaxID=904376 RepID=A0A951ULI0_9CYAN|nr:hypothetical protein [Drouetiella hepatica Uher 2000/2452]